jgi:hypothetical protein
MQGALKNATAVPFGQFEIESIGAKRLNERAGHSCSALDFRDCADE